MSTAAITPDDATLAAQFGGKPISSSPPPQQNADAALAAQFGGKPISQTGQSISQNDQGISGSETLPEDKKGIWNNFKDVLSNYASMPEAAYHAVMDDPKDPEEEMAGQALTAAHPMMPKWLGLALHRAIVEPMMRNNEVAEMYDKMAAKHPEMEQQYKQMAAGHRADALVPVFGQIMSMLDQHMSQGDYTGAATQIAGILAPAKIAEGLTSGVSKVASGMANKVESIAPTTIDVAGEKLPITASQTGNQTARALEDTASSGNAGKAHLQAFDKSQAAAADKAVGAVARKAAEPAAKAIDTGAPPVQSLPGGVAKTSRLTASQLTAKTNAMSELAKTGDFGEAAKVLKDASSEHLSALDKVTGGEFQKLTDERSAIVKQIRKDPSLTYEKQQALYDRMDEISDEEDKMLDQYGVPKDNKTALGVARNIYKQASAMEELDSKINSAKTAGVQKGTPAPIAANGKPMVMQGQDLQGSPLLRAIDRMKPKRLLESMGGDQAHVDSLRQIGAALQNSKDLALVDTTTRLVNAAMKWGTIADRGALISDKLGKILTNPAAAKALANGIRIRANAPVIARGITTALGIGQAAKGTQKEVSENE